VLEKPKPAEAIVDDSATVADRVPAQVPRVPTTIRTFSGSSVSLTTAAEALHADEVRRTRQFIAVGWALSAALAGAVPVMNTPHWMDVALLVSLAWGVVISGYYFRQFADPRAFSDLKVLKLGVLVTINTHVGLFYFGAFTPSPVLMVVGMHFIARSEAARAARYIFATALACYLVGAIAIITGLVPDPGAFASTLPMTRLTLSAGAVFVVGMYVLAYYTGLAMRRASMSSVEGLQRQTRLAAQRKALMDELRADLERALRVGGPGRHTDQTVGAFKLGNVIGRGAMGEVYEAIHGETGALAAVKLLRRELLADPTQVARFLREAKASAALASPNVVQILEAHAGEGVPYLAMERLTGQTLAELLRSDGRLAPDAVVELCRQIGAGVDAAAVAGIVHRDLKPQNLFRTREGVWKILDFGVATLADDSGTLTQGGVVGTPSYMAPEQAKGGRVDSRADVYAVAAVAYRCLTGRHPFVAPDTPALLYAVVHRMPIRPGQLGVFDPDLDRWVALALAKNPDERFASGGGVALALAAALAGDLDPKLRRRADASIKKHGWEDA
jgi:serine/threonine-protein kinase